MIKLFKKNPYRISAIALAVLLIAGITFLTGEMKTKADTNGDTKTIADTKEETNTIADTNEDTNTKADTNWDTKTIADTNEETNINADTNEDTKIIADTNEETNTNTDTIGETSKKVIDGVDCTFVDDQDVIGKWESVDLVKYIDDFVPNVKSWPENFYLLSIKLLPNGQMPQIDAVGLTTDETTPVDWITWTKGYIINHYEKMAGQYTIKEIDGTKYMFWEWKTGDYIRSGTKPYYYVLKQVE